MQQAVDTLFDQQLAEWPLAADNFSALANVRTKRFELDGRTYRVQFNPARLTSSAAKTDAKTIQTRACFLCQANRPAEQRGLPFKERYQVLVNPYPIFPRHLTVPETHHVDQRIDGRMDDMLDLARLLDRYVVFYNGPRCGASAPDHFHFQAGNKGVLPVEQEWRRSVAGQIGTCGRAVLWQTAPQPAPMLVIEADDKADAVRLFETVYEAMTTIKPNPELEEPMMNLIGWYEADRWMLAVFPRGAHRPACYFAEGDARLLISPGSVDMGSLFITPRAEDFERITADDIRQILQDVCLPADDYLRLVALIQRKLQ